MLIPAFLAISLVVILSAGPLLSMASVVSRMSATLAFDRPWRAGFRVAVSSPSGNASSHSFASAPMRTKIDIRARNGRVPRLSDAHRVAKRGFFPNNQDSYLSYCSHFCCAADHRACMELLQLKFNNYPSRKPGFQMMDQGTDVEIFWFDHRDAADGRGRCRRTTGRRAERGHA
ncbi:hypothetical protein [Breoghania sp. L-A4]|uniref:hypothetical protein n=1 Tax=Breoghania sp. L-A4 TaxID=2304600 RepID=UPI0020C0DB99|nr:hypothetical protein [Breoghania sp. L-A4]